MKIKRVFIITWATVRVAGFCFRGLATTSSSVGFCHCFSSALKQITTSTGLGTSLTSPSTPLAINYKFFTSFNKIINLNFDIYEAQ